MKRLDFDIFAFLLLILSYSGIGCGIGVVKQWSVGGKIAFLGAMRDECLKDENDCPDGFTIAMWMRTTTPLKQPEKDVTRSMVAYLLSNGGQSSRSNGFYIRRTANALDEYEIGVAHHEKLWRRYIYLKADKIVHFVLTWKAAKEGLKVYIDGLLSAHQMTPIHREYSGSKSNDTGGDPHPYFVANGDSLNFKQLFDEKTFLPAFDFSENGHVLNVTYYHEWKSEQQIGLMTVDYDDRLVAGCFYEIPFGAELVSTLNNYSANDKIVIKSKEQEILLIYYKCRNDCVEKKDHNKDPWTPWLAVVDPRTYNCFCMLADAYFDSRHFLDATSCQNNFKQTKAQFSSVALEKPPNNKGKSGVEASFLIGSIRKFSLLVPSMKCFFVVNGQFGSYDKAMAACKRRGAKIASLKTEFDEYHAQNQLDWEPLVSERVKRDPLPPHRLLWIESRDPAENTCNYCADADENCAFLTSAHKEKCDCPCVDISNETASASNTVGVLCEKIAFDLASDISVAKGFCGVPAVSSNAINAFIMVGETMKTFSVLTGKMTWDDAVEACEKSSPSGVLASIRSQEENIAVQHELQEVWAMRNDTRLMEPFWIGARRPAPHRPTFQWLDGTPVLFSAWVVGEPNNAIDKNMPEGLKGEECVGIWPNWASGNMVRGWNDFNCHENGTKHFGALCESY